MFRGAIRVGRHSALGLRRLWRLVGVAKGFAKAADEVELCATRAEGCLSLELERRGGRSAGPREAISADDHFVIAASRALFAPCRFGRRDPQDRC
jgi:hypothetical protein